MSASPAHATALLLDVQRGDAVAMEALFPLVYDELHHIAHAHMRKQRQHHTLQTTGLVHEVYLKLIRQDEVAWQGRVQFYALASRAMRHILINYAQKARAQRRGGERRRVTLEIVPAATEVQVDLVVDLDRALTALAEQHPRMARVVECRYFGGMTAEETAAALDVSLRTVEREWTRAKAYLYRALDDTDAPSR